MNPIKVEVGVTIDFSEGVKAFLSSLFASPRCEAPVTNPSPAAEPAKPVHNATPAPSAPAAAPAPSKPQAAVPTPAAPAPAAKPAAPAPTVKINNPDGISIENVREALTKKVNDHRAVIKTKLEELGAKSVTTLDPSKYGEMLDFLNSL